MDLSFQRNTGIWNARLNFIFKLGPFLTPNCSLDIHFGLNFILIVTNTNI